jgi:sterol 14-demethylase
MEALHSAFRALPLSVSIPLSISATIVIAIASNVIGQLWFPDPHRPPVVFHIFPFIGSTVQYGIDPYKFFFDCQAQYGDCFTFILLGKSTTVFLGPKGNDFILNGKHADLNAEDVYGKLTTPVFGKEVVYDCRSSWIRRGCVNLNLEDSSHQLTIVLSFSNLALPQSLYDPTSPNLSKK